MICLCRLVLPLTWIDNNTVNCRVIFSVLLKDPFCSFKKKSEDSGSRSETMRHRGIRFVKTKEQEPIFAMVRTLRTGKYCS
jgi:hypothetical protein